MNPNLPTAQQLMMDHEANHKGLLIDTKSAKDRLDEADTAIAAYDEQQADRSDLLHALSFVNDVATRSINGTAYHYSHGHQGHLMSPAEGLRDIAKLARLTARACDLKVRIYRRLGWA